MPAWRLRSSRNSTRASATELYGRVVAWARAPWLYRDLGVPDTPEGRLELILLHVTLVLHRLAREGADVEPLARALTETFVTDMDDCLREMGVGDIAVAKKVKKAAAALFDRTRDYGAALAEPGDERFARLLGEHITVAGGTAAAAQLASYARALTERMAEADVAAILAGRITPPAAPD